MQAILSDLKLDTITSAVSIAILGALASILVAAIGAFASYSVAKRSVYISSVTAERTKWLESIRGAVSKLSGMADKMSSRRKQTGYEGSEKFSEDAEKLRALLSELYLRLNPSEPEAKNVIRAAKKLSDAARLHSPEAVILANEIMVRHTQWVLKAEWERVKQEATSTSIRMTDRIRNWRRNRAYQQFLLKDGKMDRLDAIGAGQSDAALTLLRSEMDT